MRNFNSAAPDVRGYVEFLNRGSWSVAVGHPITREPKIFSDKNEAMAEVLAIIEFAKTMVALGKSRGLDLPPLPTVDEFRFVPVELPKGMDAEPTDFQAASDVLKAAAAKAKGGAA